MYRILFLIFAVILFVDAAYSQGSSLTQGNTTASRTGYYPYSSGSSWVYHNYSIDSNGVKIPGSDKTERDTIVGLTSIGGREAYILHYSINDTAKPRTFFSFDQQGNVWHYEGPDIVKPEGNWMLFVALSDSLQGKTDDFYIPGSFYGVKNVDTIVQTFQGENSVEVPAGTFTARTYSYTENTTVADSNVSGSSSYIGKRSFVRGVGIVKCFWFGRTVTSISKYKGGDYSELVSYSVK